MKATAQGNADSRRPTQDRRLKVRNLDEEVAGADRPERCWIEFILEEALGVRALEVRALEVRALEVRALEVRALEVRWTNAVMELADCLRLMRYGSVPGPDGQN